MHGRSALDLLDPSMGFTLLQGEGKACVFLLLQLHGLAALIGWLSLYWEKSRVPSCSSLQPLYHDCNSTSRQIIARVMCSAQPVLISFTLLADAGGGPWGLIRRGDGLAHSRSECG